MLPAAASMRDQFSRLQAQGKSPPAAATFWYGTVLHDYSAGRYTA